MIDAIALHEAYRRGDPQAVREILGDPPDFPNCAGPPGMGESILEYAIYHGPLAFIAALLDLGARVNYPDHAGFPSLIAALSSDRKDKLEIVELLLARGVDIHERGVNGYTPLHWAASENDPKAIELLLARGADPNARTNMDDDTTPLGEAEARGHAEAAAVLRKFTSV